MSRYKIEIKGKGSVIFDVDESDLDAEAAFEAASLSDVDYITKFFHHTRKSFSYFYGQFSIQKWCFMKLHDRIEGSYTTFLDMLGGLGCTGRIFGGAPEDTYLNEWDGACVEALKKNFVPENVFQQDGSTFPFDRNYDVTLADFNNFTLRKLQDEYRGFLDNMLAHTDRYAIITDCSNFYLRYGESSYKTYEKFLGTFEHTHEGFYQAYSAYLRKLYPEWRLVAVEYFTNSAYFLLEKTDEEREVEVTFNSRDDLKAARPLILYREVEDGDGEDVFGLFTEPQEPGPRWKEIR